ncbi:MAG: hypothetical protein ABIJ56_16825 [Pseudomonadota bacterium]
MEKHNRDFYMRRLQGPAHAACMLSLLLMPTACASKKVQVSTLKQALGNMSETIEKKDHDAFYDLLSEEQKIGLDGEKIKSSMESNGDEFKHLASLLQTPKKIRLQAALSSSEKEFITFILEDGTWKLEEGVFDLGTANTPAEALKELMGKLKLLRAALSQDALISSTYKESLVGSFDKLIEELAGLNPRTVVINNDRAFVVLPSGKRIEFVMEEGRWKVSRIIPFP